MIGLKFKKIGQELDRGLETNKSRNIMDSGNQLGSEMLIEKIPELHDYMRKNKV